MRRANGVSAGRRSAVPEGALGEEAQLRITVETISESELSERLAEAAGVGMELERELPLRVWLFRG